jgi:hypothetical protein
MPDGTSRVIGHLYLNLASVENLGAEIGWTLHPDFFGRGYAAEGASAMLDLAFGTLGLHLVRAELDPRNDASIALCRRLGMREEALFVKDMMFKGDWADTGVYAILAEEWAARRSGRRAPPSWTPPIRWRGTATASRPRPTWSPTWMATRWAGRSRHPSTGWMP